MVPSPQLIIATAKELHKTYRAAYKSMERTPDSPRGLETFGNHDHGWHKCHRKAYFLRRAVLFLKGLERELKQ